MNTSSINYHNERACVYSRSPILTCQLNQMSVAFAIGCLLSTIRQSRAHPASTNIPN